MGDSAHLLIVGGGVIGTGLAWTLADRGIDGVVVVDLDLAGVYAPSELNAGGVAARQHRHLSAHARLLPGARGRVRLPSGGLPVAPCGR